MSAYCILYLYEIVGSPLVFVQMFPAVGIIGATIMPPAYFSSAMATHWQDCALVKLIILPSAPGLHATGSKGLFVMLNFSDLSMLTIWMMILQVMPIDSD
jgi:hypothetical protein